MLPHKKIQKIKSPAFHSSVNKRHLAKITSLFHYSIWSLVQAIHLLSCPIKSKLSSDTTYKISAFNYPFQSEDQNKIPHTLRI